MNEATHIQPQDELTVCCYIQQLQYLQDEKLRVCNIVTAIRARYSQVLIWSKAISVHIFSWSVIQNTQPVFPPLTVLFTDIWARKSDYLLTGRKEACAVRVGRFTHVRFFFQSIGDRLYQRKITQHHSSFFFVLPRGRATMLNNFVCIFRTTKRLESNHAWRDISLLPFILNR